jgi:hypothetical protein
MKTVPAIMLCFDFNTSKNKNLILVPVISQNFKKSPYAGFFANTFFESRKFIPFKKQAVQGDQTIQPTKRQTRQERAKL